MPPTLSIVVVSWNVRELLAKALRSISLAVGDALCAEVIVVDNASHDGSVAMVHETFPGVHVIANANNRGFAFANNQGIAETAGKYIALLNPDTEILGDALQVLVSHLDTHPDVGVVGPRLVNPDGTTQSSRRRFPTLLILFFESTWLQPLLPRRLLARYYAEDRPDTEEQDVDWLTGAAMVARRQVVEDVGPLDEGYFMYSEELDWCRRIRQAGWRIAFVPAAHVVHFGGKSSNQVVAARHIYFQSSKIRYARIHHGRAVAETLRYWLLGQYVLQSAVEGLKWIANHRRALRAERIRAYGQVIKSGLRHSNGTDG